MKRKYFKKGIVSLSLGIFLIALSALSPRLLINADSSEEMVSERVAISKVMLVVALVVITISAYFFARMLEKSKY